jgi:hypothetical protein
MQYLFIFQLHIVCFYATLVFNIDHLFAAHPERSQRRSPCPWPAPAEQPAPSAERSTATEILAQARRKVIMKRAATLLTLAVILASSAAQMAASKGTTPPLKAIPAGNLNTTPHKPVPSNTVLNFAVMDLHGVLLTCAKQQVDTDTFSGCTLAPGRSLDDLMTSIVQTIHAEQKKDNAE